jgi:Plasmid pRiA4b ORF-3-like protein
VGSRNQRATAQVYQFKLILVGVEPPVWRRIQVPETYSFWDLHVALQDAMGWLDYHLHVFRVAGPGASEEQIGIPDDAPFEDEKPTLPGWETPITRCFSRPGTTVPYEYDFGDGWEHELTLEAVLPRQPGQKYPLCVDGARACPPEDCGGVHGYENLLTVIQDPTHEEHESMLEWLGGRFDPERFDPKRVKFDDPARRYRLAFERPRQRAPGDVAQRSPVASGRAEAPADQTPEVTDPVDSAGSDSPELPAQVEKTRRGDRTRLTGPLRRASIIPGTSEAPRAGDFPEAQNPVL